ncbi:hypothetical protein KCU98_g4235, partial [Aureobasidium melanogenum]
MAAQNPCLRPFLLLDHLPTYHPVARNTSQSGIGSVRHPLAMPSDESSKGLLLSTIANLHESGAYSDLRIVCGSDTYKVYKNIICPQSSFFHAACRPDTFMEGQTGTITLPSNPGRIINAQSSLITPDEFDWDLDVEDTKSVRAMIHYFYHHDYPTEPGSDPESVRLAEHLSKGPLVQHARMYAMGEKYGVPGLKALALRKFTPSKIKAVPGLCSAMVIAYVSTPDTDQNMRNKIIEFFLENRHALKIKLLDKTLRELPDLVYALLREVWEVKGTAKSR